MSDTTTPVIDTVLDHHKQGSPVVIVSYNNLFDNTKDDLEIRRDADIDGVTILNEATNYPDTISSTPEYQNPDATFVLYVGGGREHAMDAAKYLNSRCLMLHCNCMQNSRGEVNLPKMFQGEAHEVECGGVETLRRLIAELAS